MDEEIILAISYQLQLRDLHIDQFDYISIGFFTKGLRYQLETFAQMLHRQYADFFCIHDIIENCPISATNNDAQRHSDGSLKWFIRDIDFSIFTNHLEFTICDRADNSYKDETNRNDLIVQQAKLIINSCSLVACVGIRSYSIRNKYTVQKVINKACQAENVSDPIVFEWNLINLH